MKLVVVLVTCLVGSYALKCYQGEMPKDTAPTETSNKDCAANEDVCFRTETTRGEDVFVQYGCGKKGAGETQEYCPEVNKDSTRRKRETGDGSCTVTGVTYANTIPKSMVQEVTCKTPYKLKTASNNLILKRYCYNNVAWDGVQYEGTGKYKDMPECEPDSTKLGEIPSVADTTLSTSETKIEAPKLVDSRYYEDTIYAMCVPGKKYKSGKSMVTLTFASPKYKNKGADVTEDDVTLCDPFSITLPGTLPDNIEIKQDTTIKNGGEDITGDIVVACAAGKIANGGTDKVTFYTYGSTFVALTNGKLKIDGEEIADLENLDSCVDAVVDDGSNNGNTKKVSIPSGITVTVDESNPVKTFAGDDQVISKDTGKMTAKCDDTPMTSGSEKLFTYDTAADMETKIKCEAKSKFLKLDSGNVCGESNVICKVGSNEYKDGKFIEVASGETTIKIDISCASGYSEATDFVKSVTYTYSAPNWDPDSASAFTKAKCDVQVETKEKCTAADFPDFVAYKDSTEITGDFYKAVKLADDAELNHGETVYLQCEKKGYAAYYPSSSIKLHAYSCDKSSTNTVKVAGEVYVQCKNFTDCTTVLRCSEDGCNSAPQSILHTLVPLLMSVVCYVLLF